MTTSTRPSPTSHELAIDVSGLWIGDGPRAGAPDVASEGLQP